MVSDYGRLQLREFWNNGILSVFSKSRTWTDFYKKQQQHNRQYDSNEVFEKRSATKPSTYYIFGAMWWIFEQFLSATVLP